MDEEPIICSYCDSLKNGFSEFEKTNNIPPEISLKKSILYETANFVVFPSLGQIVEGYLIIAPKKHYIGMGGIPFKFYDELTDICNKVRKILSENYGVPIFFEHGAVSEDKKGGCCVDHAHFHAVPAKIDLLKNLSENFEYRKIDSFSELNKQFLDKIPYLYLESNSGKRFIFNVSGLLPSQYIRKLIAFEIGNPGKWNWKEFLEIDKVWNTFIKLRNKF